MTTVATSEAPLVMMAWGVVCQRGCHEQASDAGPAPCPSSPRPQAIARPDLRVVVMSATLGGLAQRVAAMMGGQGAGGEGGSAGSAPCVTSEGRSFPVTTHYLGGCNAGAWCRDGGWRARASCVPGVA